MTYLSPIWLTAYKFLLNLNCGSWVSYAQLLFTLFLKVFVFINVPFHQRPKNLRKAVEAIHSTFFSPPQ